MLSTHLQHQQKDHLQFDELDLSFRSIKVINNIPTTIKFISKLYLNGNHLMSLKGIQQFLNLEIFHFNYNLVSLKTELMKINNPFFVKELSFIANPIYYAPGMSQNQLKCQGFTRLAILNPFHQIYHQNQHKMTKQSLKLYKKRQQKNYHQQTIKRKAQYNQQSLEVKTKRKKIIGKIYYNQKYRNSQFQKQQPNTKQTKQSTDRPHLQESPIGFQEGQQQIEQIKPFDHEPDTNEQTAKFSNEPSTKISEQFLLNEKLRLAEIYFVRSTLQKCFKSLKHLVRQKTLQQQLQPKRGIIMNNHLQTIHFSLIKLRNQFIFQK